MKFKDKIIWITGASSGIGEELAYQFAAEGAKLILSARRKEELEKVKTRCTNSAEHMMLPFDLMDASTNAEQLASKIISHFGRIDILVNNGGVSQRATAQDTSMDLNRKIMEINFFSSVALTKAVLPLMRKQRAGHIVVMSSIAGKFGFYLRSAYSAAKHALHGYFESVRLENEKDGIKVSIICPGKIRTNVSVNALTSSGETHKQMDPSQEQGMPVEECVRQIVNAVSVGKEEVLIGGKELLAVKLKRLFPALFAKIIRKQNPL
jgi:dehydrogenase/reductase SDR family member 7B